MRKAVLIYDRSKEHIDKNRGKRNTTSWKTNCLFNTIAILEEKRWSYQLYNGDHNYDPTLASAYLAHGNIIQTEDVLKQIGNHVKTSVPPKQILTHFCLGQNLENLLIKK